MRWSSFKALEAHSSAYPFEAGRSTNSAIRTLRQPRSAYLSRYAEAISVLSTIGEERSIPIQWPVGFVLHDVLVSGARYPLVLRAQPKEDSGQSTQEGERTKSRQKLFEFDTFHGSLIREFLFNKPDVDEVACASATTLTSIFLDTIGNPVHPAMDKDAQPTASENPTQLVIATTSRF